MFLARTLFAKSIEIANSDQCGQTVYCSVAIVGQNVMFDNKTSKSSWQQNSVMIFLKRKCLAASIIQHGDPLPASISSYCSTHVLVWLLNEINSKTAGLV